MVKVERSLDRIEICNGALVLMVRDREYKYIYYYKAKECEKDGWSYVSREPDPIKPVKPNGKEIFC